MISSSLSPCETVITKFQVRGMLLSIFFNTFGESKFCSDRFPGLCLGVSSEISELPLLRIGWAALSVSQSKVPGRPGPPSDVWLTTLPSHLTSLRPLRPLFPWHLIFFRPGKRFSNLVVCVSSFLLLAQRRLEKLPNDTQAVAHLRWVTNT